MNIAARKKVIFIATVIGSLAAIASVVIALVNKDETAGNRIEDVRNSTIVQGNTGRVNIGMDRDAYKRKDVATALDVGRNSCNKDVERFKRTDPTKFGGITSPVLQNYVDVPDLYEVVGAEQYNRLSEFPETLFAALTSLQTESFMAMAAGGLRQQAETSRASGDAMDAAIRQKMAERLNDARFTEKMQQRAAGSGLSDAAIAALAPTGTEGESTEQRLQRRKDEFVQKLAQFCQMMGEARASISL
jgi:hypothetical protein